MLKQGYSINYAGCGKVAKRGELPNATALPAVVAAAGEVISRVQYPVMYHTVNFPGSA